MMRPALVAICVMHAAASAQNSVHRPLIRTDTSVVPAVATGLNNTALELFERSRRSYERTYPNYGRVPVEVAPDILTLDFEIETAAHVKLTPELLLQRGGIDVDEARKSSQKSTLVEEVGHDYSDDSTKTVWPQPSKWFTAGVDGTGAFILPGGKKNANLAYRKAYGSYRQDLPAQIELESVLMRPKEVLTTTFTKDVQFYLDELEKARQSNAKSGKKKQQWYPLPFKGAKGIKVAGAMSASKNCTSCNVQWTAGIELQHVSQLLRMSSNQDIKIIVSNADAVCARREKNWEYHALISLAAWTLKALNKCVGCSHPKRCMRPWLVRTHFGDIAMYMQEKHGPDSMEDFPADVLEIAQLSSKQHVLPNGAIDYLRLPEFAELSGLVHPRNPALHVDPPPHPSQIQDMPTDVEGLLQLAKKLIASDDIHTRLQSRSCSLHSRTAAAKKDIEFTTEDWLTGILHGRDLMSDQDSPLSQVSFSHLVWKSMGNWRMKPGSSRVYLECRFTDGCLEGIGAQPGAAALIQHVGQRMRDFEASLKKPADRHSATTKKIADLSKGSHHQAQRHAIHKWSSSQAPRNRQRLNYGATSAAGRAVAAKKPKSVVPTENARLEVLPGGGVAAKHAKKVTPTKVEKEKGPAKKASSKHDNFVTVEQMKHGQTNGIRQNSASQKHVEMEAHAQKTTTEKQKKAFSVQKGPDRKAGSAQKVSVKKHVLARREKVKSKELPVQKVAGKNENHAVEKQKKSNKKDTAVGKFK